MSTIKVNGKTISYTKAAPVTVKTTLITFEDGKSFTIIGSNAIAAVKAEYERLFPVTVPPTKDVIDITEKELGNPDYMTGLSNKAFKLKPGIYEGQYWLKNLNNVSFDFSGCEFKTHNVETFMLDGINNGLAFRNALIRGTNRSFVRGDYQGETQQSGFTFENISMENCGALFSMNGFLNAERGPLGVTNNVTIRNVTIKNSPNMGTAINFLGENFIIDYVIIDNVNTLNKEHSNVIMATGYGVLSNSRLTNHRGSLMRLYPINFNGGSGKSSITNNIIHNSAKYGAFDIHFFDKEVEEAVYFKASDIEIINNTAGRLATKEFDWDAMLVDIYDARNTISLKNNLCYELFHPNERPVDGVVNYASVSPATKIIQSGNKYFPTAAEAVVDTINFKSRVAGVGAQ